MFYSLLIVTIIVLIYAPQLWVRHVLQKHHKRIDSMPGTGGELAAHLIKIYKLQDVELLKGSKDDNHYNPSTNSVCLSPDIYTGKSLTAVAVAAHEVGHAIQFNKKEPVSRLRDRYLGKAHRIRQIGIFILFSIPFVTVIFRIPHIIVITAIIGIVTMFVSVLMYVAILPEEWDASFNKALPILEKGEFVPQNYLPAIKQVLKACAFTYVAAALADVLSLWRWLAILR
ncbi:MAG: zinc metallopeptidase [Pseudomonadota bacterium]